MPKRPVRLDARRLVGLPIADARRIAAERGCRVRVYFLDREPHDTFLDERQDRISVGVIDGIVTRIFFTG